MWPLAVVIEQKLAHDIAELLNRGDDEMVEAFGFEGLDEGLNVTIGFWEQGGMRLDLQPISERQSGDLTLKSGSPSWMR